MTSVHVTISALKRRAKLIGREMNMVHAKALDEAAKELGFQNFIHARRSISSESASSFKFNITNRWFSSETRERGETVLEVALRSSLQDLLKPHHFVGYFGGDRVTGAGDYEVGYANSAQDNAAYSLERSKRVARALEFIQITGLKPSSARRCYPRGEWSNRPPFADHDHCWYDPVSKAHLLSTEPYPGRADSCLAETSAWHDRHHFVSRRIEWGSIYGYGTELWLVGHKSATALIDRVRESLEKSPTRFSHI
jgi:hypothetical protein